MPRLPTNIVTEITRRLTGWLTTFSDSVVVKPDPVNADRGWNPAASGGMPVAMRKPAAIRVNSSDSEQQRHERNDQERRDGIHRCLPLTVTPASLDGLLPRLEPFDTSAVPWGTPPFRVGHLMSRRAANLRQALPCKASPSTIKA